MAEQIYSEIFDSILQVMKLFPMGASLENILQTMIPPLPKRSLQRYLALLIENGSVKVLGKTRSRRYYLSTIGNEKTIITKLLPDISSINLIPLSQIALSIQEKVRQPIQARRPVGYNREFLDKSLTPPTVT